MTKPVLGTKRLCAGCNAKFYDLSKTPVVCPMCEAVFVVPKPAPARPRRGFEPLPAVAAVAEIELVSPPKVGNAPTTGETDGDKEGDGGVGLLEEIDED
ncbi:MAG: TIGR02300 family protein [Alphaproteobacteria bacterium]|nr:TIGR02300 family protein [Alphaproteobacteria bacterium]